MVEVYRAGLGIDRTYDEVDRRDSRRGGVPNNDFMVDIVSASSPLTSTYEIHSARTVF
ncbi:hypothetical protein [Pseudomonas rhodesiae]|uniref:hypothetical protein n=1 Tax=Pseudomonas rhodesiae TaxID=76760 RepID=UPI0032B153B1